MASINLRGLFRTAALAVLLLAGATTFFTASVEPANAECKFGGPNCIGKDVPGRPGVGGTGLPGTGWQDIDCAQFGNCDSSELKGTEVRHADRPQRFGRR